ncbi:MAG TPA: hypothetical protein PLL09_03290 [Flavobacterium sp.]|uniref:hypothetical protein n=1 Tax=unclassified Flavobacterium TaxID=196869 RepID=UPI0025BA09AA|nr:MULTISPECIES: hypothetical protein [unclassified Flavobacterium]HRE76829.1 hypothetical protein [Flavobacterium sp.]
MKKSNFKITRFVLSVFAIFLLVGCSKDDDGGSNSPSTYEIVFKAEASAGCTLNASSYGYDSTISTVSSIGGTTWTSPTITAPSSANVAAISMNAMGSNPASTLKVQIYVNGVLKKEGTSIGTALSAIAQHPLN